MEKYGVTKEEQGEPEKRAEAPETGCKRCSCRPAKPVCGEDAASKIAEAAADKSKKSE